MTDFNKKINFHEKLMEVIKLAHETRGHQFIKNTFHDHMDSRTQNIVTHITDDLNVYHERGLPDAFVITKQLESYRVDCKTQDVWRPAAKENDIPNAAIEASSYAFDYDIARLGIKTLIAYHNPYYNIEKGFWLNGDSRFRPGVVMVPGETVGTKKETIIIELCKKVFGSDITIRELESEQCVSDSGDPFILVPANVIKTMQHWRELIP